MWHSRHHRKGLPHAGAGLQQPAGHWTWLWLPQRLNWWIGIVFAAGSGLFMLGGILSLAPELAASWSLDSAAVNAIFFAGSLPFTTAAYLQLYQSANAPDITDNAPRVGVLVFGWQPGNSGWLSCALQFAGTLLFNVNTFDAMSPDLDWLQHDLQIWLPDMAGSLLFLASGYLACIECGQGRWVWRPRHLSWWITIINMLGCIGFMIAAVLAFMPATAPFAAVVNLSLLFTVLGALAFLTASLLLLPEAAQE